MASGFEISMGSLRGCVMWEGEPVTVDTVGDARAAILQYAMDALGHHAHDPERAEHLRLRVPAGGPTWDDLSNCETGRRYDPAEPDAAMSCSYLLYRQGGLEGVGGLVWTYGVQIWATAPPELWNHPAGHPIDLDHDDDSGDDAGIDSDPD